MRHDECGLHFEKALGGHRGARDLGVELVDADTAFGESLFKVKAALVVPHALSDDELRRSLEALANEMMVDIALGDDADAAPG